MAYMGPQISPFTSLQDILGRQQQQGSPMFNPNLSPLPPTAIPGSEPVGNEPIGVPGTQHGGPGSELPMGQGGFGSPFPQPQVSAPMTPYQQPPVRQGVSPGPAQVPPQPSMPFTPAPMPPAPSPWFGQASQSGVNGQRLSNIIRRQPPQPLSPIPNQGFAMQPPQGLGLQQQMAGKKRPGNY